MILAIRVKKNPTREGLNGFLLYGLNGLLMGSDEFESGTETGIEMVFNLTIKIVLTGVQSFKPILQ